MNENNGEEYGDADENDIKDIRDLWLPTPITKSLGQMRREYYAKLAEKEGKE